MTSEIDVEAFRAFERAGWDAEGKAASYDSGWGLVTCRCVERLLDAASVERGTRVLDLACGPGYVAAAASRRAARATGVDIAQNMVELARLLHPDVEFRQCEAERLPFPDASFDAVVANFLVNHLAAPEQTVSETCRVLKPGGRAAFTVWDSPDHMLLMGVLLDALTTVGAQPPSDLPAGPPFFLFADAAKLKQLLHAAGLEQAKVHRLRYVMTFASADEVWDLLVLGGVRISALVLRQPPVTQRLIREHFERNLAAYAAGNRFRLPVAAKLGVGRRPIGGVA